MAIINPEIFREYDIRGISNKDLNPDIFELIGKSYGTYMREGGKRIVSLGRDCRSTSPEYSEALSKGMTSTGISVVNIGMVSTPMLYFSLFNLDVDGGIMVTASHNPGKYNGVKLCNGSEALYGEQIQEIRNIAESANFITGNGSVEHTSIRDKYLGYLRENLDISPGLKVAIDYGNGMVGIVGPEIIREFKCDSRELYTEPDGTFPNHHPDPTVEENLKDLIYEVKNGDYRVGLAFDGDGDRVGVIDENGNIIWGDLLVLIFALDILKHIPGAKVIGDVKCSSRLFKGVEEAGGQPIMWSTGHSLMKKKMKIEKAALGGEMSGHIFFADRFYGYDDALYAGLRLFEILSKTGKSVSELIKDVPVTVSTPEIRVDCPDSLKFKVVEKIKEMLRDGNKIIDIDGVRIEYDDGWGLIRASNTQPALVLRFEAKTEERLQEIRKLIESKLDEVKATIG